ncbi:FKBP-type peptidyl-prolyl cis-trans isomerase [Cellulomonas sp.]|uniref:FKBP-type peptidyl-prolyl cis-trans isomerase n=1 Tax=Cellulomonas sp. TaxID=40001 RepID=UPI001B0DDAA8|nr:FKBP-type peptidyl-prolyl cis-trans isomerase [Cellulomonas sp.]MBO9553612.1 FKBP-type peptidyl-prolyl cis-trans isomerase [Cellulomonas sp.]
MRRTTTARGLAAATLALALSFSLAACSGDSGGDKPTASASASAGVDAAADKAALAKVKLEGEAGKEPTITLPSKPFNVTGFVARMVEDGDGDAIKDGQNLSVHMVVVDGKDGSVQGSTYTEGKPQTLTAGATTITELDDVIKGSHVGARILLALAAQDTTQVYSLDIVDAKTIPARAEGEAVPPVAGLPTITLDDTGAPSIAPVAGAAPADLVVQPLVKGAGPAVEAGQTVTVKYTGWLWDGTKFDSSWDRGSTFPVENVGQGQVISGWNKGLVGQTVGSQVLLVVPPSEGYGDEDKGTIPPNSTLVFVIDILDAA